MADDPGFINATAGAPAYDATELRRLGSVLMMGGHTDRFGTRSGVHPAGSPAVTLSGTTITVAHTRAVVYPALTSTAGPYTVALQSEAHSLPSADGANPRKDIVVMQVQDHDEDSSGERRALSVYVTGAPAASPSEPALPTGAFRMATIDVPASGSGSATLTYNAPFYTAVGGVLPVRTASELPTGGLYDGMIAWDRGTNTLVVSDGSSTWEFLAGVAELTTSTSIVTAAAGFSTSEVRLKKWGPFLVGMVSMQRSGANITATSSGNIPDTLVGTLASGWRPAAASYDSCGDGTANGEYRVDTDGTFTLRSWSPNAAVSAASAAIRFSMRFDLP